MKIFYLKQKETYLINWTTLLNLNFIFAFSYLTKFFKSYLQITSKSINIFYHAEFNKSIIINVKRFLQSLLQ